MGRPDRLRAAAAPFTFASHTARELRVCPRCGSERSGQQPAGPAAESCQAGGPGWPATKRGDQAGSPIEARSSVLA